MATVSKDEGFIDILLNKGVENIYPSKEFLREKLKSGKQLKIYLGIDPTGPTLHLGHAIPLRKLRQFQDLGHKVILLIGSFTAMIGDPDKTSVRVQLTKKEVKKNMQKYLSQASKILNTKNKSVFDVKYNDTWLAKMKFEDVLTLASKMTVQQMIERDMFSKRIKEGKPVYIHEFMYPLMQGYDSVAMDVDGEVGGNDQTFNMLAGRTLLKEIKGKEKFVITTKLLVDPQGTKMGKSEGNMITFEDTSEEMYAKVMSWTDGMVFPAFELCTTLSDKEIDQLKNKYSQDPKKLKMILAKNIVSLYFKITEADKAEEVWVNTFEKKQTPDQVPEIKGAGLLLEILVNNGSVASKSEARRLFEHGAITDMTENKKVSVKEEAQKNHIYKIGKHTFIKVI